MTTNQSAPGSLEVLRVFLNTWRIPNDTRLPTDELLSMEAMLQFYATWFASGDFTATSSIDAGRVRALRDDLRQMMGKEDLVLINGWLAQIPLAAVLKANEVGGAQVGYRIDPSSPCQLCSQMLAVVMEAIGQSQWLRFKACPDCQWVFYDHTKNHSKVWCTMTASGPQGRSCGSIAKVRHFRERQKQ
jgi:hypothetical protein